MVSLKPSGEGDSGEGASHLCHPAGGSGKGRARNTVGFPSVETNWCLISGREEQSVRECLVRVGSTGNGDA